MKQKNQLILFLALVAVAAAVWYSHLSSRGPALTAAASESGGEAMMAVDNPQLHWWKIEAARKTVYEMSRRNIFSAAAAPVPQARRKLGPALPPTGPAVPQMPVTPPAPVAAPLPVKFFGYASAAARGPQRAFLTDGEQVFVISEGEILLGRFRILRIGINHLEYEEVSTGLRGMALLEEQSPAS